MAPIGIHISLNTDQNNEAAWVKSLGSGFEFQVCHLTSCVTLKKLPISLIFIREITVELFCDEEFFSVKEDNMQYVAQ